jgi:hypothetical protein
MAENARHCAKKKGAVGMVSPQRLCCYTSFYQKIKNLSSPFLKIFSKFFSQEFGLFLLKKTRILRFS